MKNSILLLNVLATLASTQALAFPNIARLARATSPTTQIHAASAPSDAQCPDLSGSWTGGCQTSEGTSSDHFTLRQFGCVGIWVDGQNYAPGVLRTESSSGADGSASIADSHWSSDHTALELSEVGLARLSPNTAEPAKEISFQSEVRRADDKLLVTIHMLGETVSCTYSKN